MYPPLPVDPATLAAFQLFQQQQQQLQLRPAAPAYAQPMPLVLPAQFPAAPAPYAPAPPPPLPRPRRPRAPAPEPAEQPGSLWVIVGCLVLGAAGGAACERHFNPRPAVAAAAAAPKLEEHCQ